MNTEVHYHSELKVTFRVKHIYFLGLHNRSVVPIRLAVGGVETVDIIDDEDHQGCLMLVRRIHLVTADNTSSQVEAKGDTEIGLCY